MENRWCADSVALTAKYEGIEQGRQEQVVENVNRMYQKGYSVAVIADVLDTPEDAVKAILGL